MGSIYVYMGSMEITAELGGSITVYKIRTDNGPFVTENKDVTDILNISSSLLGSSFPRNPLTYHKGGFLEILFLGAWPVSDSLHIITP